MNFLPLIYILICVHFSFSQIAPLNLEAGATSLVNSHSSINNFSASVLISKKQKNMKVALGFNYYKFLYLSDNSPYVTYLNIKEIKSYIEHYSIPILISFWTGKKFITPQIFIGGDIPVGISLKQKYHFQSLSTKISRKRLEGTPNLQIGLTFTKKLSKRITLNISPYFYGNLFPIEFYLYETKHIPETFNLSHLGIRLLIGYKILTKNNS